MGLRRPLLHLAICFCSATFFVGGYHGLSVSLMQIFISEPGFLVNALCIRMNRHRDMEVHYGNNGCPYITHESSISFYDGFNCGHTSYTQAYPMNEQGNFYWPMNVNAYKFEYPGPGNTYYDHYEVTNHIPHMDVGRGVCEYPSILENEELATLSMPAAEDIAPAMHVTPEECSPVHDNSQVIWQDNIDPDNMTYEELLDLVEALGTESRGLSQELINTLPTSRYKPGGLFSRKRSKERCVICQMRFKIGERRTKLPCKHRYHSECISKWLTINKVCPICNVEVLGVVPKQ